ncbi:MAG TPA: amidohydrolase family protein [Victivallales bacterium]|nr:amidohydrolase family protein [Victivallales bacterium]
MSKKPIIDCHNHIGISINNYLVSASFPYAMTVEDLIVRMNLLGVDKAVIFPFESSYYPFLGEEKRLETPAFSKFPYERENLNLLRETYEIYPEYKDRIIPFIMFDPSKETEAQAKHIKNLSKTYKINGFKTVTTYIKAFVKDFNKPGNHIRELAKEMNVPLIFHSTWMKTDPWANVFDVIELAEKNPDLRFCVAHSARFVKDALDKAHSLPNCFVDTSAFKIHCDLVGRKSAAIPTGNERFEADYANPPSAIRSLVEAYPGTIIWGSDSPYHQFRQKYLDGNGKMVDVSLPASYDDEFKLLKSLPTNLVEQISYHNTMEFLGLKSI